MDVKPKAEPLAGNCIVALSGAYNPEGTDPQSDQAASPTPIMLFFTSKDCCKFPLAITGSSAGPQESVIPGGVGGVPSAAGGMRGPSEAVSSSSEFTHDAIMLLVQAMAARWDLYGQRERSRLFQSVQQEMESHGYPLPVEKIRRKWNNLIVTYKRVKERGRGRGHARTSWEYYEVMDAVLGKTEIGQGSSASATLLGLATTAQAAALCDDPPSAGPSSALPPPGLFPSNLIATPTPQVPALMPALPQRATPPMTPPSLSSAPPLHHVPQNAGMTMSDPDDPLGIVSPPRPKMNFLPSSRRKSRPRPSGGGVASFLSPPPHGPVDHRHGNMLHGCLSEQQQQQEQEEQEQQQQRTLLEEQEQQQQRTLLEEQRHCRQEARERRRERTANRVAEAVGRMATALELISSKQDTIIALLQRLADRH